MKTSDLKKKWDDLRGSSGAMQRIDPEHPLDFFVGISKKGFDELALFSENEPSQLRSSVALEVEINSRQDGKWATQIYSIDDKNQDIFARLCVDLVECSKNAHSEREGLSLVANRYLAWCRLFASIHDTLPTSVLKGLMGELSFARNLISKGFSADMVISSWQGPEGSDRDFVINDAWYEIKAIATGKDKVTISSMNQLESSAPGYLIIYNIDPSSKTDSCAKSVKGYIDEFRELIKDFPEAQDAFERKLNLLGYIDKKPYEDLFFVITGRQIYSVDDTFPRIVTNDVPPEITGVKYDISLPGIDKWKVEDFENGIGRV